MKQSVLLFLLFLLAANVTAQTAGITVQSVTIKGKLVSADDQNPLPYATISISRETAPANSIKKLATREDGSFSTTLTPGKYIVTFHFVGMNDVIKPVEVTASQNPLDMGVISMTESAIQLDELSVTAQRPLVKVEIDKLTYSAKDDPEASTSNVLDMLRKVPLVTVDGEDEIQLKGLRILNLPERETL